MGEKEEVKKMQKHKERQTHPAQWMGLKALIRGLGVGGSKSKKCWCKSKKEEGWELGEKKEVKEKK